MPHQDMEDLRTPVAELKELLAPIRELSLASISRHGNATLHLSGVMIVALLTFGWNQQRTHGDRFKDALTARKRGFGGILLAGSFQALMVALRACGDALCHKVCDHLVPEQGGRDMIAADPLAPGSLYTASVDDQGKVGLYRLEVGCSRRWG